MSHTILLADDSLTIQKVVELTFADTEYDVVAVSSGDDLLQRLPETRPDLVICDVIMPGKDGYEVCQEIKSNSDFLHLPVILLTGTFEPFDRDRAIAVGCSEIITKPFEAKKLVDAVERLAAAPAAPPPHPAETQEIAPEELTEFDADEALDDTDVSPEFESVGAEQAEHAGQAGAEIEDVREDAPPVEPPLEYQPDEFELDDDAVEWNAPDLPEVEEEAPPTSDFSDFTADSARTLAADDFEAIRQTEEVEAISFEEEPVPVAEPFVDTVEAEGPFSPAGDGGEESGTAETEFDDSKTTPIDVAAALVHHPPEVEVEADAFELDDEPGGEAVDDADTQDFDEPSEDSMDDADTQDFGDKPPIDEEQPDAGLSDEDVDRIARRLLELYTDRIENIAWDVIPDMAEVVVRERVREIEAETEKETS